jgi:hypothetical protein
MDPLLITTQVDLSGANQLASGVEAAMARVVAAQLRVKAETIALKDAYSALGPSASAGNQAATAAIAEHETALVAASTELKSAKAAVDALAASEENETSVLTRNISARQAATATISLAEGRMLGANRAAAAFLSTTLGLGPILQAAFPIIGIAAFATVLYEVGKGAYDLYQNIVNLKGQIEALGEASSKTAREAAAANWEYIQTYAELLKAQGKFGAAQQELASHAGDKPERLSLGLSKEQLKELPQAMQDFAKSLEQVNTAGQASAVFKELDKQIDETAKKIQDLQDKIDHPKTVTIATYGVPTQVPEDTSRYSAQLTAATEYENSLKNLRQANASTQAAEQNKVARDAITLSKDAATQQASALKNLEDVTVASYERQRAEAHAYYEQGIIDAQQWAEASAAADIAIAAAHEQYYTKAAGLFRAAGDAQKASALSAEGQKSAFSSQTKDLEDLAKGYETLNKTLEEYQGSLLKEVANEKEDSSQMKASAQAIIEKLNANRQLVTSEQQLSDTTRQYDYSARANAIAIAGAKEYNAEASTRTALQALYQLENEDAVNEIKKREAEQIANIAAAQAEIARLQSVTGGTNEEQANRGVDLSYWQAQLTQLQAAYDVSQGQILAKNQQFNQQMTSSLVGAIKQQEAALNEFVSQGTAAFNSFLVTITTTTGVVNGRPSEFRFIGEEWQKMVFQMEKDFLSAILKMIEDTALFQGIQNKIKNAFANLFGSIGLGPTSGAGAGAGAGAAVGGATTAEQSTATSALIAFTAALHTSTLALTQGNVATNADTAATHASAVATLTDTGATHTDTAATLTSTAATHTDTAATVTSATASHAGAAATLTSAGANTANATAATTSATVFGSHTLAVIADTIATQAHKIAQFLGFEEGGVIPFTGLHLLHAGERVLSVKQRASYEQMAAAGGERLPAHAFDTFRSAQYAFAGAESLRARDDGETDDRPESSRSAASSVGSGDSSASDMHFHYHASPVSALDSAGVRDVISNNRKEWEKIAMDGVRRGAINPRRFVR